MSKRRKRKTLPTRNESRDEGSNVTNKTETPSVADGGMTRAPDSVPSRQVRRLISAWLVFHLFALFVSFTAVVEPSTIHSRIHDLLTPYLHIGHFGADNRPLYLAYGEAAEQPHRLQVTDADVRHLGDAEANESWFTVEPDGVPGFSESDRYGRWLSTVATLAENDQPSLVAELLLPIVEADETIRAIRVQRVPTDLNSTLEDDLPPPYSARVVRGASVSLVQLQSPRLSAAAVEEAGDE